MNNRILVVDDEKEIVQAYLDLLNPPQAPEAKRSSRTAGAQTAQKAAIEYEILHAYSGEEAIALMQSEYAAGRRIAGGFFDVKLEGAIDGLQLIRELWKLDQDILCTVVTAYHDRSINDIDQLFGSQFKDQWDYLNKPFTQAEIIQKARQMVASWNRKELLKQTQAQLIQSEKLASIGQLARSIGHEFGNILLVITGNSDFAMKAATLEKAMERVKNIRQAADRASIIIRNLNSFAKHSNTRASAEPAKLIADTLTLLSHETVKYNATVTQNLQPASNILVSVSEIEQVLLNLMINAMHAMPSGGNIEVGCKESADMIELWVKDSGTGIPSDVLPRIFEYAFTTKGDKGSGLGLAISKQILENHGGSIHVDSTPGAGSTFTLKLPKETAK